MSNSTNYVPQKDYKKIIIIGVGIIVLLFVASKLNSVSDSKSKPTPSYKDNLNNGLTKDANGDSKTKSEKQATDDFNKWKHEKDAEKTRNKYK